MDYAGFTFNGKHTSQFGLYSVSSGDRYSRYLSPTIKNQTADNIGGNGMYFFGSQHTQQTFNFNLAFDSVSELELREIKQWLNSDVSPLVLDELPYIQYYAKVSAAPQIQFLSFDNEEQLVELSNRDDLYEPKQQQTSGRVYKGEIAITFVCYDCYGYNTEGKKWLENYDEETYFNKEDWAAASGLVSNENEYYNVFTKNNDTYSINLYNAGDLPTDFILEFDYFKDSNASTLLSFVIELFETEDSVSPISNLEFSVDLNTSGQYKIDSRKRLVIKDNLEIYNDKISAGNFFKIPTGESCMKITGPFSTEPKLLINYRYIYI